MHVLGARMPNHIIQSNWKPSAGSDAMSKISLTKANCRFFMIRFTAIKQANQANLLGNDEGSFLIVPMTKMNE